MLTKKQISSCESKSYSDIIQFSNDIMIETSVNKGEKHRCFKLLQWNKKLKSEVLNYISDHVTLVQFIDTVGNVNLAVPIDACWIFDYNYQMALTLIQLMLDMICFHSKDYDDMYAEFEMVYCAFRYVNPKENFKLSKKRNNYCNLRIEINM